MIRLSKYDLLNGEIKMLEGGLNSLLSIPESIEPDKNDWGDENGLEVDLLLGVQLQPHKASFKLYAPSQEKGNRFVSDLLKEHTHQLSAFGRTFVVRPTAYNLSSKLDGREEIEIQVVAQEEIPPMLLPHGYDLTLSFKILEGSEEALHYYPEVKEGHSNGYNYIGGKKVLRKHREVEIKLFLSVPTWSDLWRERDLLRLWLTSPSIKTITHDGTTLKGYYHRLDTTDLHIAEQKIIWTATLSFIVTEE